MTYQKAVDTVTEFQRAIKDKAAWTIGTGPLIGWNHGVLEPADSGCLDQ